MPLGRFAVPSRALAVFVPVLVCSLIGCREKEAASIPDALEPGQIPPPPTVALVESVAVDEAQAPQITFRHQYRTDEVVRYRMTVEQSVDVTGRDVPAARSEVTHEASVVQKVLEQDRSSATLEVNLTDVSVKVAPDLPGAADDLRKALEGARYTVRTDVRGRVLELRPAEGMDPRGFDRVRGCSCCFGGDAAGSVPKPALGRIAPRDKSPQPSLRKANPLGQLR